MEFAIIAAGEGSRLAREGYAAPKPLVTLNGMPLIHRLINTFLANGAQKIHIIINEYSPQVEEYLLTLGLENTLNIVRKTTPSSLHSFYELHSHIQSQQFCLTTVDTVFKEAEFAGYIKSFLQNRSVDALMAVTGFVDDEKPLYIAADAQNVITGFYDKYQPGCNVVSGGIYCMKQNVFPILKDALDANISRMRNFQRMLVQAGLNIQAYEFSKIVDIDHVQDIASAEEWLKVHQ